MARTSCPNTVGTPLFPKQQLAGSAPVRGRTPLSTGSPKAGTKKANTTPMVGGWGLPCVSGWGPMGPGRRVASSLMGTRPGPQERFCPASEEPSFRI